MEPLLKKNEKTDDSTIIGYEISKDLDSFLINIYYYYRYQGFQNIVISHITNVLTIIFTLFISCLLFFINGEAIKNCKLDDFSCKESLFLFNFNVCFIWLNHISMRITTIYYCKKNSDDVNASDGISFQWPWRLKCCTPVIC